jgi:hypothetical protein
LGAGFGVWTSRLSVKKKPVGRLETKGFGFVSHNVLIEWFQKVNSSEKLSTRYLNK